MILEVVLKKTLPTGLMWLLIAAPMLLEAQASKQQKCTTHYPELQMEMNYFCDARQLGKTDTSISFSYEMKDAYYKDLKLEESLVGFVKHKSSGVVTLQEFEKYGKSLLDKRLTQMRPKFKLTTTKTVTGGGLEPKLRYTDNTLKYTHYTYLETSSGTSYALEYTVTLHYDNGKVAATSFVECLKLLSGTEASQYKNNTPPAFALFYSAPAFIRYKPANEYRVNSSATGLTFELAQHNLMVTELPDKKIMLIDYSGVQDDTRASYQVNPPVSMKLVKKLAANEKFATIAAPYLKESINNELNDYDAKKYPAFKNMVVFKKRWEYRPGQFSNLPDPYRYLFEFNGHVYDLSGEIMQKTIMDSILKTIQIYKGPATTASATGSNQNETFNRDLLSAMEAWLKDYLASSKGDELKTNTLGALMTKQFQTSLKLQQYPTVILEEGLTPDKRRDWLVVLGSYTSKEAAAPVLKQWTTYFQSFKHELFQWKQVKQTAESVVWMPVAAPASGLPPQFAKMELQLLIKELFLAENGKMVTKYEVQLRMGSKL